MLDPTVVQLLGTLGGAFVAFAGIVTTNYATGRRERKNRSNAHLSRLIEKRYDLYLEYIDILDTNADMFLGDEMLSDRKVTVSQLQSLEHRMRVYASEDVLTAFEFYRDCMRRLAADFDSMIYEEQGKLRYEIEVSSTLALAMIRADLEVDAYDSRQKRRMRKRALNRTMRNEADNFKEIANYLYGSHTEKDR